MDLKIGITEQESVNRIEALVIFLQSWSPHISGFPPTPSSTHTLIGISIKLFYLERLSIVRKCVETLQKKLTDALLNTISYLKQNCWYPRRGYVKRTISKRNVHICSLCRSTSYSPLIKPPKLIHNQFTA